MSSDRAESLVAGEDPSWPLSAAELGQALGIDEESVRRRERAGELFSTVRPRRNREREYPAFQAWPGIAGAPLARVMAALQGASGPAAYGFFTSPTDLLGGLTPIEVMVGRAPTTHAAAPEAETLLNAPGEERMAATVRAAEAHAALLAS